jgi:ankyrin repeat protein
MRTKRYVYGVDKVNGYDAWALFEASAQGNDRKVKELLARDSRLVNAQFWYQFPTHMAVRAGHADIVQLLLEHGADPGQSRFTYNSWDKLLLCAQERGYGRVEALLRRAMQKKFNYSLDFEVFKEAIIARDARKIAMILRRKPNLVRASDALGNNALHWSVITRQLDLIERFAELGTPIDAQRADGQTPVLLAVNGATDYWYRATRGRSHPSLRNTSVLVGSLLARGASYKISIAAAVGDQERVEQCLRQDSGLAGRLDSARISPLSYAAREGHLHIVRLLLEQGAEPNKPEDLAAEGRALFEACARNHLEVAEVLLEHRANPNAGLDSSGCCLTIAAYGHGRQAKPLQKLLKRHGAYPPPYAMNVTQMKQSIRQGHPVVRHEEFLGNLMGKRDLELLDLYLESHPGVLDRLDCGSIPHRLPHALVPELLARGLDPNRTNWLGKTFLHACAENGAGSDAVAFLDAGADLNAREFEFQGTPLASAVRACGSGDPHEAKRSRRMVEFLLQRGAATNLPDDEPWATPLAWATRRGNGEMAELLKQHGAK